MTPPLDIRPIHLRELPQLLALYTHLHRSDAPLPEAAVVDATWRQLLAQPGLRCFGGLRDGALVASCTLAVIPNLTRGCRPYGVIENVVTHAAHRRQGVGHAMLAHALAQAWSVGCYKVMLMTGRKDEATRRFYESAGFDADDKQAFTARPAG